MAHKGPLDLAGMNRAFFETLDSAARLELLCRLHVMTVELSERVRQTSTNSSRPPSSDSPFKGGSLPGLGGPLPGRPASDPTPGARSAPCDAVRAQAQSRQTAGRQRGLAMRGADAGADPEPLSRALHGLRYGPRTLVRAESPWRPPRARSRAPGERHPGELRAASATTPSPVRAGPKPSRGPARARCRRSRVASASFVRARPGSSDRG